MRNLQWFSNGLIIMLNFILRYIIIFLVKLRGNRTRSEETSTIMSWILIVQFLNMGPFLLLINSDLSMVGIPIMGDLINQGRYADFTQKWYLDVGPIIVQSMIYNIFWPIIEFFVWYTIRFIKRFMDNPRFYLCCCSKKYKYCTKTKTIP